MKPGFALDLTHDAIGLLQRAPRGWVAVGRVDLSDPDLGAMLNKLRRTAKRLSPEGFATKLILPDTQILYLEVEAQDADRASCRKTIAAALEGRTPYRPDELVFDWSGTGKKLKVAVVARVTLDEAESFAEKHRLNPVSFVTRPPAGSFAGEPFFGLTARAGSYLPAGEKLERDQDPVRIIAAAQNPPAKTSAPEPDQTGAAGETPAPPRQAPQPSDAAATGEPALRGPVSGQPDGADDNSLSGSFHSRRPANAAGATGTVESLAEKPAPSALNTAKAPPSPRINLIEPETVHLPEVDFAAKDVASGGLGITADHVPVPDGAIATKTTAPRDPAKAAGLFGRALLKTLPDPRIARTGLKPRKAPDLPGQTRAGTPVFSLRQPRFLRHRPRMALIGAVSLVLVLLALAIWLFWPGGKDVSARDPAPAAAAAGDAAQDATAPGPAVSTDAPAPLPAPTQADATDPVAGPGTAEPARNNTAATNAPPELAAHAPEDGTPTAAPSPEPPPEPAPDTAATETHNARDLAGADIWTDLPTGMSPPPADATGAPDIADAGPGPAQAEPENLPGLAAILPDQALPLQVTPPPFGTILHYDARGMVIPTRDGVVTNDGVTLIAGRPPRVPAPRPQGLVKAAEQVANPLAGKRPRARPEGIPAAKVPGDGETLRDGAIVDPASGNQADASPGGDNLALLVVDPAHAALKPRERPASVQAQAERARTIRTAIAEAAAAALDGEEAGSALAVETSRRPVSRPRALARAVEAAIADAVASAPSADGSASSATVEIDEPEPTAGMPDLPTTITVAKQATVKNAINLSKVSLIGVYGSSANRRALFRSPNGKFLKVKIGDQLDGGKVAAIGDNEVSYVKHGRTIVLKMSDKG